MNTVSKKGSGRTRRAILGAICGVALLASIATASACAMPTQPGGPTTLSFVNEQAHLVGSEALVLVRCEGPRGSTCNGALRLSSSGKSRTTPVSIVAGSEENVDVSLGHTPAAHAKSIAGLLSTVQSSGAPAQSRAILYVH